MEKIAKYNFSRLQRMFRWQGAPGAYFFVREEEFNLYDNEPFRTETYAIAFLRKGSMVVHAGLEKTLLDPPCIFAMGPDVIRRFERGYEKPLLDIIFFTREFFLSNQADVFFLSKFLFFDENQPHAFALDARMEGKYTLLYDQLRGLLSEKHIHEARMVKSFINILIHETDALYREAAAKDQKSYGNEPLVAKFKSLLTREFMAERSVSYYADQLNVTAKYLSEYLKEKTGRSASQWINEAIILEAKVLLQSKELTVAQVSEQLNFSDQSVFGKFFKANADLSPASYRRSLV